MAEKGEALSDRELEVLQCVIDGAGNKEIAATLVISENTVKVHLRNIYTKLDVNSRTEASTVALQQGLVTLEGITTENNDSEPEPEVETAVTTHTPPTITEPDPPARPAFFPRRIALAGLLLVLLVAVVFLAYQAFGGANAPTPTPEPFAETSITDDWLQSRPLPTSRSNMALVGSGLNLYLIGGETETGVTDAVSILQTADLVWQVGAAKPTAVTDISGAELFGEIYIPGGQLANGQPTNVVEVYSPANDSWRVSTPLPAAVSGGLVLSDGSFIYLFGGWNSQNYLANAYRFDPVASNWQILPEMATARAFATGGVVKGKLYVVGGFDGERPLTECAGSWHSCADTLLPRAGASATGVFNKLYLFGGGAFGEDPITYSESYNPDADQWSIINTPPLEDEPSWSHLGITSIETNIYAVGGVRGTEATNEMFVYRPLTYQTFIPIAPADNSGP
jgi:DNA-binding CsgD family transcriptional regulator/N-acetylneuraminic acid mutarotase